MFFWSAFSHIWNDYGDLQKSPYSVRMRENGDQKNSGCGHFSRAVIDHAIIVRLSDFGKTLLLSFSNGYLHQILTAGKATDIN